MKVLYNTENLPWEDHPSVKNVSIKKMITREQFGEESPSIIMVKIPARVEVPEHIHEKSEDILFILFGRGTMWIDEIGEVTLQKGTVVCIPRNTKHRIFDVSEELLVYDVFSPGIM
ncbi:MAG: cupin domain-containing protein [Thermodesulfobacteriota bacterium]|nr:cupin domain-containing protein [Thermodesulfobacteriota bacterium]